MQNNKKIKEIEELINKLPTATLEESVKIHHKIANFYETISLNESERHLKIAIDKIKALSNEEYLGNLLNEIAVVYLKKSDYENALEILYKAIDIFEKLENKKGLIISKRNLAILYAQINNYDKALEYSFQVLEIEEIMEPRNHISMSGILNNIAIIYRLKGNYDKALKYNFQALELRKKINNITSIASSYNNIGLVYKLMNNNEKALEYMLKSFEYNKKENKNTMSLINNYINLGDIYTKLKDYEKAENFLIEGTEIAKKLGATSKLGNLHYNLFELYSNVGDYQKALEHHIKYSETMEKIFKERLNEKLIENEVKHQIKHKEQEAEIYRLKNVELKKINDSKDRFFSIVAHDLKSPFSVIISFIRILRNALDKFDKDRILSMVDELDKSVKNAFNLLENLLEWSRMQSGVIKYSPQIFDVNELIKSVIISKEQIARQKGIELLSDMKNEKDMVFADKNMIRTVIRNLVSNAIKFTKSGGSITVSCKTEDNKKLISVKDTGVGISKENIDKLFNIETNFSTYGTSNEKGTGLGLILCKEFVEKNNGTIHIKSEIGKGTEFYFYLPISDDETVSKALGF